jgi:hypothetical protein
MPESGTYGSVRGVPSNGRPYRDQFELSLEPARLPWTTLRVAHRADLCPLAHSLPPRSLRTPWKTTQDSSDGRYKAAVGR